MDQVLACVAGGGRRSHAVVEAAAWAAKRIEVPLVIEQHGEEPPRFEPHGDFNGAIWLGPTGAMLNDAAIEDRLHYAQRRKADEQRLLAARRHAQKLMGDTVEGRLTSTSSASEVNPALIVRDGPRQDRRQVRPVLDPGLAREVRAARCQMLLVPGAPFATPEQVVIAFDGSAGACDRIDRLSVHPLLAGLPVLLVIVGAISPIATERLHQARQMLQAGGVSVVTEFLEGAPATAIAELLSRQAPSLLVMGAFGCSRLRRWLSGSTTAALLLASTVPVLIQR